MPEETWHYLENQFESVTRENRKLMDAILTDAHAKFNAGAGGHAAVNAGYLLLNAVKVQWDAAYSGWFERRAAWRSTTQALLNLLAALQLSPGAGQRSKIDRWESKVASFWSEEHAVYAYLFPLGREPFTSGSREEIIGAVEGLGTRLNTKSGELAAAAGDPLLTPEQVAELNEQATALAALSTEVLAFHGQLDAARLIQTQKEGLLDGQATLCEQRRQAAAVALYRALAKLMDAWAEEATRPQVADYFDLSLIMNPPEEEEEDEEPPPGGPPAP